MTTYYSDIPSQGPKVTITQFLYKTVQAAQALNQFDVVFLDGQVVQQANPASSATMPAIGMVTSTVASGANVDVTIRGLVSNTNWNWTSGNPVFAALSAGGLTQTPPSASGQWVQWVGIAATKTSLEVNLRQAHQISVS